ncbi:MAG: STAS domain-containing protein [Terracidiphilus sp.]|jgi:anti-anti-sigma factor
MTGTISNPMQTAIFPAGELKEMTGSTHLTEQANMPELVRGTEQDLLAWLAPLVRQQSVTLDLRTVERIDAAGIAALILLYSTASQAGHSFMVTNPSPHVAEILALVGLDRILLPEQAFWSDNSGECFEPTAA